MPHKYDLHSLTLRAIAFQTAKPCQDLQTAENRSLVWMVSARYRKQRFNAACLRTDTCTKHQGQKGPYGNSARLTHARVPGGWLSTPKMVCVSNRILGGWCASVERLEHKSLCFYPVLSSYEEKLPRVSGEGGVPYRMDFAILYELVGSGTISTPASSRS